MILEKHGTRLHVQKPSAIISAAEEDMRRKVRNGGFGFEHYAFHRLHVRKSICAADLLAVALRDCERGRQSGKLWTRLIYADEALLRAALQEALLRAAFAEPRGVA